MLRLTRNFFTGSCKNSTGQTATSSANDAFLFPVHQIETEPEEEDEDEEEGGDVNEDEEMEKARQFQGDLRKSNYFLLSRLVNFAFLQNIKDPENISLIQFVTLPV